MPLSAWAPKFKMPLNSNPSKSSLGLGSDVRGSQVYHGSSSKLQGTSSELHLDQQKIRRLQSIPSQLNRSTKPASNASVESFYTADQESNASQTAHIDDITQTTIPEKEDAAKTFADRAWNEDPSFVDREKLVEWLGSPTEIRQQTLVHYMANFEFGGVNIDEAIRRLCYKLYIKGETQQIDRILGAFSDHYMMQNPNAVWRYADVVHVVTFAIILLNTDLQAAELQAHITNSRFVDNAIEAIRAQLQPENTELTSPIHEKPSAPEHLPDIQELPQAETPTTPVPSSRVSSPLNLERRPTNSRNRISSFGSIPFNRDSWVVPEGGDNSMDLAESERWMVEVARELSTIYNNVRSRPILQSRPDDSPTSPHSKVGGGLFKRGSAKLYHSLRGESPYAQSSGSPSGSGASFVSVFGHRVSSSMSSLPHFFGLGSSPSLPSSTNADLLKSDDSPWAKTGSLLWKSMKPTPGRIAKPKRWLSVLATVRNSTLDMCGPSPPGNNSGPGRRLGALSLLHALAQEVPAPKGSKIRSFGLTLPTGETHVFEIQAAPTGQPSGGLFSKSKSKPTAEADVEVQAWVQACNYHAARYSRAPLPDGVTNAEYGWNGAAVNDEDDQSSVSGRGRTVLIDDWAAPVMPPMEAQVDAKAQLEAWIHQVEVCNTEFTEHGEMRGRMMGLYRPGSAQGQRALSNWEKKAQYLLTEIVKYETYAEVLRNTELATPVVT